METFVVTIGRATHPNAWYNVGDVHECVRSTTNFGSFALKSDKTKLIPFDDVESARKRDVGRPKKEDKLITIRVGVPESIVKKLGEDNIKRLWRRILENN